MNCKEIWIDIIIPLISALMGGGLTLLGVWLTIFSEKKKEKVNEIMKHKPYLKLAFNKSLETIDCKDHIQDTFDQDNIDFDNTDHFYTYLILPIDIMNSSNAECILKEIIIDGNFYRLNETLLLRNEPIRILTTKNLCINSREPLKNISISVCDILGNKYYYKCEFKEEFGDLPSIATYKNGKQLSIFHIDYEITNIGLPTKNLEN